MKKRLFPLLAALALLATGCAQLVHDRAIAQMREGRYEQAIKELEAGLEKYPDNVALRSSLISARGEAFSRLTAQAAQYRAAGQWDEAEKLLQRALQADPGNDRLQALIADLATERRVQARLQTATKLSTEGKKAQALHVVEQALREIPRHSGATAMRRQLEADLRVEAGSPGRAKLAESRPITLDFRGAPLMTVLEAITRGSGINFILDRDVRQDARVTVFLRSAAVEDAIDLISGAHQLARRVVDSQTVLIYPNTVEKHKEHQEQVVRVFHLANAEAKSTAQLLRSMLRLKDPFVDERANLVAIRESPDVVAMAERLVALHDASEPEVMLEVEILEIKTSRLTELGIAFPNSVTLTPLGALGDAAAGLTVSNLRDLNSGRIGVTVGNVVVNLRREVGDFSVLANPRIRTKNREKARIVIGDRFPVVTSTATATGLISESVNYLDVGLKLDVEPVVSLDDDVTIKLGLEVSAIAGAVRTERSLAYQVGTRNANTVLRLRNGETQILAGLISNDDRTSASRVPGLGDLPIAGRLFSSQKDEFQRTELMLAITPRVLRSSPRPDFAQAEMWIGTDNAPRLREAPRTVAARPVVATAAATIPATPGAATPPPSSAPGVAPTAPPVQTGEATLSWKGPASVKAGEVFTVPVHLSSTVALRGALFELAYPAAQVDVLEVTEGTFFKQNGGQTNFTQSIRATDGKVSLGVLRNDMAGAVGDAPVVELRLRAKAAGPIEVKVTSLRPMAVSGSSSTAKLSTFQLTAQ